MTQVLDKLDGPEDLKKLELAELDGLAAELRELIIETVSKTGGHLGPNLGVVELTIALLRTFDPAADRIVWDVSHQGYTYKILTGRKDRFSSLRQYDGLSGFLKRGESDYDVFGAGHAGTALSAALGMAVARDRRGSKEHVVAILGDGAAGNGISLEAMNNLHGTTQRLIMILNDNEMSIAANTGSMSRHFGKMLANPRYNRWKWSAESFAHKMGMGWLRSGYYKLEEAIKSLFLKSAFFEELGFRYVGPVDGHNLRALLDAMSIARDSEKPIILHVATQKGKGYRPAENQPEKWHSASPFERATGEPKTAKGAMTYSRVFGTVLERLARDDENITAITAAMASGTGLSAFAKRFPDRFFDVGMSEEHAVVFAAGLAVEGLKPVFAVYSTFLQRSVDCMIHDVCLQQVPVVICVDRAGVVGDDGPTHHGIFDIPLLRPVPGLVIMQPKDEAELAHMLYTALGLKKPVILRYPRGTGPGAAIPNAFEVVPLGVAEVLVEPQRPMADQDSKPCWIWALGDMIPMARDAVSLLEKKGIRAGIVNARYVAPLDTYLLGSQSEDAGVFVTLENSILKGGFGSGVEESLLAKGYTGRVLKFGWPDEFIPHGKPTILMEKFGLTAEAVADAVVAELGE